MSEKILFVDDEPHILQAYKRALYKQFTFDLAESGKQALELITANEHYAVIISDMRMPGMDGIELLSAVKKISPNTVRVMLTGNSDQKTAIDAVNQGDIFRFLNKPCAPQILANTLKSAVEQYRLINAEKELLQKTLGGSIRAMTEILSLVNPEAFNSVANIHKNMISVIKEMGIVKQWWMEPMALLSQIGCVILPRNMMDKIARGDSLSAEETQLFEQYPLLGADLLSKIPRLENIVDGIRYQEKHFNGEGIPRDKVKGADIPFGSRLLKVLLDFERCKKAGLNNHSALESLRKQNERYDPEILEALIHVFKVETPLKPVEVKVRELRDGMVLFQDVKSKTGNLIVNAGQEITPAVRHVINNFSHQGNLMEPLVVKYEKNDT